MQIFRTIIWVILTAILVAFIAMNWTPVPVNFWPLDDGKYLHFEWPIGIVALIFFALGFGPLWLFHRAGRWRLQRRIASLENTVRATSVVPAVPAPASDPAPAATTTSTNEVPE